MTPLGDVLYVAGKGMWARPVRHALMLVGPILGAAVIVGSIGLLESAQGEVRAALSRLGQNLIVVSAAGGGGETRLSAEALDRATTIQTVETAAEMGIIPGLLAYGQRVSPADLDPVATQVFAAGPDLLATLGLNTTWGRGLSAADEAVALRSAVVGSAVAGRVHFGPEALRTIYVGEQAFAIVGVLEPALLMPSIDGAVLIPNATAQAVFGADARPSDLVVRVREGSVEPTARLLPQVVTYGEGAPPTVHIASDLLEAQAVVDQTLAAALIGLGVLVLAVGSFGNANVMLVSVLERRQEIGIRRALGHRRRVIAGQFLAEAFIIAVTGGLLGVVIGLTFILVVSSASDWLPVINPISAAVALVLAVGVTTCAGLYPALRAANLEPLEVLRMG